MTNQFKPEGQQAQEPLCAPHFCNTCDGTGETPQECSDCDGHGYHIKPVASPAQNVEAVDGERWYCVSNDGGATLRASQDEAVGLASTGNFLFPNQSPHVARKMQTATNAALQEENDRLKKELEAVGAGGVQAMGANQTVVENLCMMARRLALALRRNITTQDKDMALVENCMALLKNNGLDGSPLRETAAPEQPVNTALVQALKEAQEVVEMVEKLYKQAEAMQLWGPSLPVNVDCQISGRDLTRGLYVAESVRKAIALAESAQPAQCAPDEGTPASRLLQEARQYWKLANAKHPGAVQWIENKESGEFLIFTRGEYRERLLRGIGEINDGEDARNQALAECRDAFPAPAPGSSLEPHWQAAMAAPRFVPVYLRAIAAQHTAHDAMGIPKSCGRPLCSDSQHHPLCRMSEQSIAAAEWMRLRERFICL